MAHGDGLWADASTQETGSLISQQQSKEDNYEPPKRTKGKTIKDKKGKKKDLTTKERNAAATKMAKKRAKEKQQKVKDKAAAQVARKRAKQILQNSQSQQSEQQVEQEIEAQERTRQNKKQKKDDSGQGGRQRTSVVYELFEPTFERNKAGQELFKCKKCLKIIPKNHDTPSQLWSHLKNAHLYEWAQLRKKNGQQTGQENNTTLEHYSGQTTRPTNPAYLYATPNMHVHKAIAYFLLRDKQPIARVESPGFIYMITQIVNNYLIPKKKWWSNRMLPAVQATTKRRIKAELTHAARLPSITTDLWTSKTRQAYQGLTVRYVNSHLKPWKIEDRQIGLQQAPGSHTAVCVKEFVEEAIDDWCIKMEHGKDYNGICLPMGIGADCGSNIVKAARLMRNRMHVPCLMHIMHRAVICAINRYPRDSVCGEDYNLLIAILHKISKVSGHFRHSPQKTVAIQAFVKQSSKGKRKHKQLETPVVTRWHTYVDCTKRYLDVADDLGGFFDLEAQQDDEIKQFLLSPSERVVARDMVEVLSVVKDNLVPLQDTSLPTITYVTAALNNMCEELELRKGELPKIVVEEIKARMNNARIGWLSMFAFFNPAILQAEAVYPSKLISRAQIEKHVKPFVTRHINALYNYCDFVARQRGMYKTNVTTKPQQAWIASGEPTVEAGRTVGNAASNLAKLSSIYLKKKQSAAPEVPVSFPTSAAESIELYKGTQPGPDDYVEGEICPLRFWANHAHKFPALAVLAEWVFGLPPTSTRSESLFSSAGGILTAKRSCLTPANAEILTFLWANVTPGDLTDLKPQQLRPGVDHSTGGLPNVMEQGQGQKVGEEAGEGQGREGGETDDQTNFNMEMTEQEKRRARAQAAFDRLRNFGKDKSSNTAQQKTESIDRIPIEELNFAFQNFDSTDESEWFNSDFSDDEAEGVLPCEPIFQGGDSFVKYAEAEAALEEQFPPPEFNFPWESIEKGSGAGPSK